MPDLSQEYGLDSHIERADGCYLYRSDGRRFLDASSGLWNVNLGYGREDIVRAISEQLSRLPYLSIAHSPSHLANELAYALLELAPQPFGRVMFHCTGTAAVEGAVLLARQHFKTIGQPNRVGIVALDKSFHGGSLLGENLSGYPEEASWFAPLPPGFYHIPAPDSAEAAGRSLEEFVQLINREGPETIAAFVFEPIMAVAGVIVPPDGWVKEIINICRQNSIITIADEVTTGLGRAGAWFACEKEQVDIIVVGKGLSAGYMPVAAALYKEELFAPFSHGEGIAIDFGSTMDGYPAACACGLAVIEAISREQLVERAAALGDRFIKQLKELEGLEIVGNIRGRGMMIGIPLVEPQTDNEPMSSANVKDVISGLAEKGLLIHRGQSTLTVFPPLTIDETAAREMLEVLSDVLSDKNRQLKAHSRAGA